MEVIKCFFYLVYGIKSHLQEPRPHLRNGRIQAVTKKKAMNNSKSEWFILKCAVTDMYLHTFLSLDVLYLKKKVYSFS